LRVPNLGDKFLTGLPQPSALRLAAALFPLLVLPDLLLYAGAASSEALGTAVVAVVFLLCSLPMFSRWPQPFTEIEKRRRISIGVLALGIMAGIAAQGVVSASFLPFDAVHALGSAALLVLTLLAGAAFADVLLAAPEPNVDRVVRGCLLLLGLMVLEGFFGLSPPSPYASPKPMFPFTEPSHFALTCAPFFMYCAIRYRGAARLMFLLTGVIGGLMMQNLTFLIAIALTGAICLRRSLAVPVVLLLLAVAPLLDLAYYSSMLDFS
jgi:hypothetical protein